MRSISVPVAELGSDSVVVIIGPIRLGTLAFGRPTRGRNMGGALADTGGAPWQRAEIQDRGQGGGDWGGGAAVNIVVINFQSFHRSIDFNAFHVLRDELSVNCYVKCSQ